jgi:hypothetical protein
MTRVFTSSRAVRKATPLLLAFIGPSFGGKTFSALRVATGIKRVSGGDIYVIDTEQNRALHYADDFDFHHVPFAAPFSPGDYLEAIKHCVDKGARTVIIDSFSHEHEGEGGVLEWHQREVERLSKAWNQRADAVNFPAWAKPKAARQRLMNTMTQLPCNFILCFRAKEKAKPGKDDKGRKTLVDLGWLPIGAASHAYEMTLRCLLEPGSDGVPTFAPSRAGEAAMFKLPRQFRELFAKPHQLCEADGEAMARWAAGPPVIDVDELVASVGATTDVDAWKREHATDLRRLSKAHKRKVADRGAKRRAELLDLEAAASFENESDTDADLADEAAAHERTMTE